jgi:hypothetical protein
MNLNVNIESHKTARKREISWYFSINKTITAVFTKVGGPRVYKLRLKI